MSRQTPPTIRAAALGPVVLAALILPAAADAQHSVARLWNEAALHAVRNDFARPTVHARSLFHIAVAMYDAWAAYDDNAPAWLLGNEVGSAPAAFSRAAAEVMTLLTGDEFFPGGLGEFRAEADEFLQLEDGHSVDVTLQWATYRAWQLFSGSPTAVEETSRAALPGALALAQNFPNPFNAGTVIRFDLDRPGEIELSLHDLGGRRVATLARGPRPGGRYEIRWDGHAPDGSRLASGVYLYRLRAGERSRSRKLLLR